MCVLSILHLFMVVNISVVDSLYIFPFPASKSNTLHQIEHYPVMIRVCFEDPGRKKCTLFTNLEEKFSSVVYSLVD